MAEPQVKPSDCALALCIPLTKRSFLEGLDPASPKDFVKSDAARLGRMTAAERWERYLPIVRTVERLRRELEPLGVTVVPEVTPAKLLGLLSARTVVTLVAHWRFAPFSAGDILDVAGLVRRLRAPRTPLEEHVAREFKERGRGHLLDSGPRDGEALEKLRDALAAELKMMLDKGQSIYASSALVPGPQQADAGAPFHLTRIALEDEFPDVIRPGPSVEFHDGLKTIPEVVKVIPPNFSGVLDLTVCNSVLLGESIKRRRKGFLVICNRRRAAIHSRLIRYRYIIMELARRSDQFTRAVTRLSVASLEALT